MIENYVITIGRQYGSGGHEIGERLAKQLGLAFYDKELIYLAAKKSGLKEEIFSKADEKKHFSLLGGWSGLRSTAVDDFYSTAFLSDETLFQIQSDVIRELAEQPSCLFVGRCADYVLKEHPRCLNVFISADLHDRLQRLAARQNLAQNKAQDLIDTVDKQRAAYYHYFTSKVWGAVESYHLCLNSSFLGIDETVRLIRQVAERKFIS
jgi:cytidylate kinase